MSRQCIDETDGFPVRTPRPAQPDSYLDALSFFESVLAMVPPERWDARTIGEWTVAQLVGHMTSSIVSVTEGLAGPGAVPGTAARARGRSAVDWFLDVLATPGLDDVIEEDGVVRGAGLGDDPATRVAEHAQAARAALRAAPVDGDVATVAGPCPLPAFLDTRTVELVLHTFDLADSMKLRAEPPEAAARVVLTTLAGLVLARGDAPAALRWLSGRRPDRHVNALSPLLLEAREA